MLDLIVRGGTILDGTGRSAFQADLAVEGDAVAAILRDDESRTAARAVAEIDASGLFVAPGFIDVHSHSDYTLVVDPRAMSAIHQGVTSEVVGNCGYGCFPIQDPQLGSTRIYGFTPSVPITWRTAGEYFERLEAAGPAVNVASLAPNGQLRLAVVGADERAATPAELRRMGEDLRQALDEGAWGLSSGLEYSGEGATTEDEMTALCRVAARAGRPYATHTRNRDEDATGAVREAIRTAEGAGARLQVSHLVPHRGMEDTDRCIAVVDEAAAQGVDVAFDMHTRLFGTTYLSAAVPADVLRGSPETIRGRLRDPSVRERVRSHRSVVSAPGDWDLVELLDNRVSPESGRKTIAELAAIRERTPIDVICDLLADSADDFTQLMIILHYYSEEEQRRVFVHPRCVPGSDATDLATDGPLADSTFHGAYTWAAWFYRFMAREAGLLTPEEAVRKLSGQPAELMGIADRGVLREGAKADVAIFEPESFGQAGTTYVPNQLATGMRHVIVNGVVTLTDGRLTGERGGRVLKSR